LTWAGSALGGPAELGVLSAPWLQPAGAHMTLLLIIIVLILLFGGGGGYYGYNRGYYGGNGLGCFGIIIILLILFALFGHHARYY
jgi:hypothetical protein